MFYHQRAQETYDTFSGELVFPFLALRIVGIVQASYYRQCHLQRNVGMEILRTGSSRGMFYFSLVQHCLPGVGL